MLRHNGRVSDHENEPETGPDKVRESVFPPFGVWPRPLRISVFIALALVGVLVVVLLGAVHTVRATFPQTDGEVQIPGVQAKVEVRRDVQGIPQIYAESPEDLFLAQGYVQAQDRFYEMDFKRHVTSGRLSELLGESTLETDQFLRALDWRGVAQREWVKLAPETRANLESFSEGVNAWIARRSTNRMSLEYVILGLGGLDYRPEKWTPVDSLAWLKAMAWDLRGNMDDEIDRALMAARLQPEQIAQLYPAYPFATHLPIVTQGAAARPAPGQGTGRVGTTGGDGIGSNSWVVSGDLTTTGKPLLANDPHLGVSQPGVWYQMGLHCRKVSAQCPYDVSGFTLAGVPGVVIGHNQRIAWGFTNLSPDVSDLYLEQVQGKTYRQGEGWEELTERDEVIRIKGAKSKKITIRSTRRGPLLSDVSRELSSVGANASVPPGSPDRGNGYAVSLAWTGLIPSATADAVFLLNKAGSWADFRDAARKFAVPSQNLIYADVDGNIGYQAPGMIPIRRPSHTGDQPAPGWDPANEWTGKFIDFEDLPHVFNPDEGFIVTANQAVAGPAASRPLGSDWDRGYRSQRIRDLLAPGGSPGRLDREDMTRIQLDTRNPIADKLVPLLLDVQIKRPFYRQAQDLLRDWDGDQGPKSAAAAYFNSVWRHLIQDVFVDQVGPRVDVSGGQRWMGVMEELLEQPRSIWWDDADTTDVIEDRDQILRRAMVEARDELTKRLALDPTTWEWGRLHTLELKNQSLGQSGIGVIESLFNRGPWRVGGGSAAVDATNWDASIGYGVESAPSMRMVVDLADFDRSLWINLTGASGHAFHSNYTDQTDLWARGEYLNWRSSRKAVVADTEDLLVLEPRD